MQKVIKRGCWSCWLNKQDRAVSFNFYALNLVHFMFALRIFHSFATNSAQVNNWNYPQNDAKQEKEPRGPTGEQRTTTPSTEPALRGIPFLSSSPQGTHRKHETHWTPKFQHYINLPTAAGNLFTVTLAMAWRGLREQQELNAWPNLTGLLWMTTQQK